MVSTLVFTDGYESLAQVSPYLVDDTPCWRFPWPSLANNSIAGCLTDAKQEEDHSRE